jgi:hypothetical protein
VSRAKKKQLTEAEIVAKIRLWNNEAIHREGEERQERKKRERK